MGLATKNFPVKIVTAGRDFEEPGVGKIGVVGEMAFVPTVCHRSKTNKNREQPSDITIFLEGTRLVAVLQVFEQTTKPRIPCFISLTH